ncbi:hypothetical protein AVEN_159837-1 [Araneus ventricosus]|uniref:Uncharacterized protein n=1 Tax=Araneus ventricosus TaxID=182803 RepID=A0A4Y2G7C3_ARAVE|nr:hypothetical protein AVEN_159837-1 [Araneus ventricosus]
MEVIRLQTASVSTREARTYTLNLRLLILVLEVRSGGKICFTFWTKLVKMLPVCQFTDKEHYDSQMQQVKINEFLRSFDNKITDRYQGPPWPSGKIWASGTGQKSDSTEYPPCIWPQPAWSRPQGQGLGPAHRRRYPSFITEPPRFAFSASICTLSDCTKKRATSSSSSSLNPASGTRPSAFLRTSSFGRELEQQQQHQQH